MPLDRTARGGESGRCVLGRCPGADARDRARSRSPSRRAASAARTSTSSRARSRRRLPIVPGHQAAGRVVAVGRGRRRASLPGDAVGVGWIASTCGRCRFCRSGRENLCPRRDVHGARPRRRIRRDAWSRRRALGLPPAPPGFSAREAAPLLCAGIIGYRSLRLSGIASRRAARPLRLRRVGAPRDPGRARTGGARSTPSRGRRTTGSSRARMGAVWAGETWRRTPASRSTRP